MDRISLVLATFNGEKYLREQLDSIYGQTEVPDEVIAIDDCSTDGTVSILEEYQCRYGLKLFVNDSNLGYNGNFAKGISLAKGDYICLCDQDDVWKADKVEKSLRKLKEIENGNPACVSSNAVIVDENLNILAKSLCPLKDSDYKISLYWYSNQGCTLMFNRKLKELLFPFPENISFDLYIGTYAIFVGNRYHIGEPLMLYRQHGNNAIGSSIHGNLSDKQIGSILSHFILSGMKTRILTFIRDNKKTNPDKTILLENTIQLFAPSKLSNMTINIIKMSYFSWIQKLYALYFLIKNKLTNL